MERIGLSDSVSSHQFLPSTLLTGTDNAGLFILRDDRCSIVFLLVVEFMVVSGRDTARAPTPRQENDECSQPKLLTKKPTCKATASPNLEDRGTVLSLTSNHLPLW